MKRTADSQLKQVYSTMALTPLFSSHNQPVILPTAVIRHAHLLCFSRHTIFTLKQPPKSQRLPRGEMSPGGKFDYGKHSEHVNEE